MVFQESQGLKIAVDTEEKQVEAERFTKVKLQVEALVAKTFSSTRCKSSCFESGQKKLKGLVNLVSLDEEQHECKEKVHPP